MHIMFVDDNPYQKVEDSVRYLKEQHVDFTYAVIGCSDFAIQYLKEHKNAIDLAVIDLGLPKSDDGNNYHSLRGLDIIDEICNKYPKIPVIINSVTHVSKEKIQKYVDGGLIIKHCKPLSPEKLIRFMKKGNVHLVEPSFDYDSGIYVFWVDSDDDSLVKTYYNRLKKTLNGLDAEITISSNKIKLVSDDPSLYTLIKYSLTDWIKLFNENLV